MLNLLQLSQQTFHNHATFFFVSGDTVNVYMIYEVRYDS